MSAGPIVHQSHPIVLTLNPQSNPKPGPGMHQPFSVHIMPQCPSVWLVREHLVTVVSAR